MPKTLEMDEDAEAEALTQALFDQLGAFVNMFIAANIRNKSMTAEVVIGALGDHLGTFIGKIQCRCGNCRGAILRDVIEDLVQDADANVVVTVHDDPGEAALHALATMKPLGRA